MAERTIDGVTLAYELMGDGPPVAAGRLSPTYKILIWDRRNCGLSDIAIEDAESEWHPWHQYQVRSDESDSRMGAEYGSRPADDRNIGDG